MTSDKINVSLLRSLFVKKGLTDIVISPGSRNAPIVIAFAGDPGVRAYSIVDERSAAFTALGMAKETGKAVAIASTSGTAPLNYSPAVAEAFYQKIPLLILTADRPEKLVDVGDGQTIRQQGIYNNFIKKSYNLPDSISTKKEIAEAEKLINEAIDLAHYPEPGPVHINLPFDEPLYGKTEQVPEPHVIDFKPNPNRINNETVEAFIRLFNNTGKIMILAGQQLPDENLRKQIEKLSSFPQVTVLTETTSNFNGKQLIGCIDNTLATIQGQEAGFAPDFLITFGDAVVSKKIKKFLRENRPHEHWHISPSGEKRDTYFSLTQTVKATAEDFFVRVLKKLNGVESNYNKRWLTQKEKAVKTRDNFLKNIPFTDFKVYDCLFRAIPRGGNLHLGNSTPVRYSQLFGNIEGFTFFSNRGVSGIDGQISTAAGISMLSEKTNTVITGDLGFFYDSNAFMNKYLKANLKVIIINNGGGSIFRFIPGPDTTPFLEEFFESKHHWNAEGIARAFNIHYYRAANEWELKAQLPVLYKMNKRPGILEIITSSELSTEVLKNFFKTLTEV